MESESIELTDIVLRVIGAFYAFAGYVATRSAMMSRFLDQAIAAIAMKKPTRAETAQNAWLLATAALVLTGGVLLLGGLELAAWVFVVSALGQAAYISYVAPRYFDADDPPGADGRRQTTNAFVIFAAATAFIVWAAYRGRLTSVQDASTPVLIAVAAALLLCAGYVARTLWWSPRKPGGGGLLGAMANDGSANDPGHWPHDDPSLHRAESKRVKLMADYMCEPLWALDDGLYGSFAPEHLGLSQELSADINAWAAAYDSSFDPDDPVVSRWSETQHQAHAADGRTLAVCLKRERPDLMVYVLDGETGVVEVHADEI
jgi:hypothetical protein